jgi:hypothetical protein
LKNNENTKIFNKGKMIELTKANPDIETWKLFTWILLSFTGFLIGVIVLLVKTYFTSQRKRIDEFEEKLTTFDQKLTVQMKEIESVIASLKDAITDVRLLVELVKHQQSESDPRTERRLNDHGMRIDCLDKKVAILETKVEKL